MLDIESIRNRARAISSSCELFTPCGHTCLLIPAGDAFATLLIPDDVESLGINEDKTIKLHKELQELQCESLKVIGGKGLKNTSGLFSYLGVSTIDITELSTNKVTDMSNMFFCCGSNIKGLDRLETSNVKDMSNMFAGYGGTEALDLRNFNTSKVTSMSLMFAGCKVDIDLSSFDTHNVLTMAKMFEGAAIENLNLNHFDTSKTLDMHRMFCRLHANTLNISKINTENVRNMGEMFLDAQINSELDLRNFSFDSVTNLEKMFGNSIIKEVHLDKLPKRNQFELKKMFMFSSKTKFIGKSVDKYVIKLADDVERTWLNSEHLDFSIPSIVGQPLE